MFFVCFFALYSFWQEVCLICVSLYNVSFLPSCCCHDDLYVWFSAVGVYVVYVCVCTLACMCVNPVCINPGLSLSFLSLCFDFFCYFGKFSVVISVCLLILCLFSPSGIPVTYTLDDLVLSYNSWMLCSGF